MRELGVALGPAIGWVEEGLMSIRDRDIVSLQTVFNILEQEPGLTFAAEPKVAEGQVGLISRVPHASDTLSGKVTRDTVFPEGDHRSYRNRENMLDNFDKADTLAVPVGGHRSHAGPGGDRRHPREPRVRHRAAHLRRRPTRSASTPPHPTFRSPTTRTRRVAALWAENFGVTNRYEMPLKSSV